MNLTQGGVEASLISSKPNETIYRFNGEKLTLQVDNVYGYLPATKVTEDTKTIAFIAHYDSVKDSNGAADSGLAIVSIFAGLDQVIDKERVNNIVVIITDHKELGLVGAKYLEDYHPEILDEIDFFYNLEARGTSGKLLLFETSDTDYKAVRNYVDFSNQAYTASFGKGVFDKMINITDYTIFNDYGIEGMNFSIIEDFGNYHTYLDTVDNIPEETSNTYINNVVSMVEDSAFEYLDIEDSAKAIYFNYFNISIVIHEYVVYFLIVLEIVLFFIIVLKNEKVSFKQIGVSIGYVICTFIATYVIAKLPLAMFGFSSEYRPEHQFESKVRFDVLYNDLYLYVLLALLIISSGIVLHLLVKSKLVNRDSIVISSLFTGLVLTFVLYFLTYKSLTMAIVPVIIIEVVYLIYYYTKKELVNLLLLVLLVPLMYHAVYYSYIALTVKSAAFILSVLNYFIIYLTYLFLPKCD